MEWPEFPERPERWQRFSHAALAAWLVFYAFILLVPKERTPLGKMTWLYNLAMFPHEGGHIVAGWMADSSILSFFGRVLRRIAQMFWAKAQLINDDVFVASAGALGQLSAAAWPLAASAYRPFDSTDAAVADMGEMEIELGPLGYVVGGGDRDLVAPSLIVNWGFAAGWEAVLEGRQFVQLGNDIQEPRFRVEDTAFSLKGVLRDGGLQEKAGPSVATEASLLLPTLHGEPGVGAEWAVIVSQRWTDLTVHLNGAAAWTRAREPGLLGGIILEGHDAWAVRPVAEALVESERDAPTTISGLVGAIWRVREGLSFDAGVRLARAGGIDTTELRAGLTWAFRVGFPR